MLWPFKQPAYFIYAIAIYRFIGIEIDPRQRSQADKSGSSMNTMGNACVSPVRLFSLAKNKTCIIMYGLSCNPQEART